MNYETTNIFNAVSSPSQNTQFRLLMLALSGDTSVTNAFTQLADELGVTPEARRRKETERRHDAAMNELMRELQETTTRLLTRLDLLDQASMEALFENEKQQRVAGEELEAVRKHAYEVTLPDGSVTKVYRDGQSVRDDSGAVVGGISPDELPANVASWDQRKAAQEAIERLEREHREITDFRERLDSARDKLSSDDVSAKVLDSISADIATMPDAVRRYYEASATPAAPAPASGAQAQEGLVSAVKPLASFARAASGDAVVVPDLDQDVAKLVPSVSLPAPR